MAEIQKTTNYNLLTPSESDFFDVDHQNVNMGIIDAELKNLNDGKEALVKNAAGKESIADIDSLPLADSADSQKTKKITFANMKAVLKAYFDTLYNKYIHPEYTSRTSGLYKVIVDGTGHVSAAAAVAKSDITALGIPAQDTVTEVVDSLASTDAAKALSAKQGKTLNDLVSSVSGTVSGLDAGKVPTSRKINGKPLVSDIALNAADVGALASSATLNPTYTTTLASNMPVPSTDTVIDVLSLSLPPGKYLVFANVASIGNDSGANTYLEIYHGETAVSVLTSDHYRKEHSIACIINLTETTTVKLRARGMYKTSLIYATNDIWNVTNNITATKLSAVKLA